VWEEDLVAECRLGWSKGSFPSVCSLLGWSEGSSIFPSTSLAIVCLVNLE